MRRRAPRRVRRLLLLLLGAGILLPERLGDDDLLLNGLAVRGQDALDLGDLVGEMLLLVGAAPC